MDAPDTYPESQQDRQMSERRQWQRRSSAVEEVTIGIGADGVAATVVDASPGGMGLRVHEVAGLQLGQQVELSGTLEPIAAVVRFITATDDGAYRVGVEWLD